MVDGSDVVLGSLRLPRHLRTAWRVKKGDYLDLDSLVFFLSNEKLKLSEYIKACGQAGVQSIPFGERKDLTDWLKGGQDPNQHIDQELVALLRGASLECLCCGEFVMHARGGSVFCPECCSQHGICVAVVPGETGVGQDAFHAFEPTHRLVGPRSGRPGGIG